MAAGDVFEHKGLAVAAGAYTDVDASLAAGEEAVVQTVYHEDTVTLERGDGTDWTAFLTEPGDGAIVVDPGFRCRKGGHRVRVKNEAASAKSIWMDGVKTK